MKFFKGVLAAATAGVLSMTASAASANLVSNGDFETTPVNTSQNISGFNNTTITDWTSTGTFVLLVFPGQGDDGTKIGGGFELAGPKNGHNNGFTDTSPSGGNFMAFDSDPSFHGTFSQSVGGLTVGQVYDLSFWFAGAQEINAGGPTTTAFSVSLGGQSFTTDTLNTPAQGFTPWKLETFHFTYDGANTVLSFLATGGPGGAPPYALLDGVTLTAAGGGGVPEPAVWTMMILGFGGAGVAIRRRQARAAAA